MDIAMVTTLESYQSTGTCPILSLYCLLVSSLFFLDAHCILLFFCFEEYISSGYLLLFVMYVRLATIANMGQL